MGGRLVSWPADLRRQVLADFAEAQRARGVADTSDERAPTETLAAPVVDAIKARARRVVRREERG